MSNEIDFEEFIRNIDCAIYEKIDVDNWNISIEVVLDVVEFLQRSLEDLRTYIVNHPFSSKEEEIYFFKHIKPEVLSRLSDYPFMHLLYSQLLVCQRVCLQNTVCLICK